MKLYVSADMEGTAGVCSWTQVDPSNTTEYPLSRRIMSQEVRAAIDGARQAADVDVLVNDSHWTMRNLLWEELPADVRMISGNRKPFSMTEGADASYDVAFFTGYHAPVGTRDAVLDHTYSTETLYRTRVNGIECSELLLNAALLGSHRVPVMLVTGDVATIEHARQHLPWAVGVAVKRGIGRYAADSLSPEAARDRIRAGAADAIRRAADGRLFLFEPPVRLELDFLHTHNADFAELIPGFERTGGRSVRFEHHNYHVVFKAYVAALRLGGAANEPV